MRELDALVGSYVHLDKLPRASEALRALQKIASLVKPIMRRRGWRVGTLVEFWPDQRDLLGLNVNKGQRICLRLRYAGDRNQFLPLEHVVDTMLHELSHNVHGPHDAAFHDMWNKLRDEYDDLKYKGYTGEGFLSEGHRVGGVRVPLNEVRRQVRQAPPGGRLLKKPAGQKLGGAPVPRTNNIRAVIADAATRRGSITNGCASGTQESELIANEATRNGFRTQAEEDQANERAIAEALWELAQEASGADEMAVWESDGLTWNPETGLEPGGDSDSKRGAATDSARGTDSGRSTPASISSSSLLPASTYAPPPNKKQKQKQDVLLPATTYEPPKKKSASPSPKSGHVLIPAPPPTPPSPPPHMRPNPRTEMARPDSSTLGTTFALPRAPATKRQVQKSSSPSPRRGREQTSTAAAASSSTLSLSSSPPLGPRPAITDHPAFRRRDSDAVSEVSTVRRPSEGSPHPSAFDSPVLSRGRPFASHAPSRSVNTLPRIDTSRATTRGYTPPSPPPADPPPATMLPPAPAPQAPSWTCPVCTLSNPATYLCCDACAAERPCHGSIDDWSDLSSMWPAALPTAGAVSPTELPASLSTIPRTQREPSSAPSRASSLADSMAVNVPGSGRATPARHGSSASLASLHGARSAAALRTARSLAAAGVPASSTEAASHAQAKKLGWVCAGCGAFMENRWWTCTACHRMKESS